MAPECLSQEWSNKITYDIYLKMTGVAIFIILLQVRQLLGATCMKRFLKSTVIACDIHKGNIIQGNMASDIL